MPKADVATLASKDTTFGRVAPYFQSGKGAPSHAVTRMMMMMTMQAVATSRHRTSNSQNVFTSLERDEVLTKFSLWWERVASWKYRPISMHEDQI